MRNWLHESIEISSKFILFLNGLTLQSDAKYLYVAQDWCDLFEAVVSRPENTNVKTKSVTAVEMGGAQTVTDVLAQTDSVLPIS